MFKLTTARETFMSSALGGLAAGVATAAASVMVLVLVAVIFGRHGSLASLPAATGSLFLVAVPILIVAVGLALFPIGPMWVVTAWLLRRGRFTAPWVYAVAGALVASYVPLLPTLLTIISGSDLGDLPIYVAWFALAGGVGGYVSGRGLRGLVQGTSV